LTLTRDKVGVEHPRCQLSRQHGLRLWLLRLLGMSPLYSQGSSVLDQLAHDVRRVRVEDGVKVAARDLLAIALEVPTRWHVLHQVGDLEGVLPALFDAQLLPLGCINTLYVELVVDFLLALPDVVVVLKRNVSVPWQVPHLKKVNH
jgi:hypothetical protein